MTPMPGNYGPPPRQPAAPAQPQKPQRHFYWNLVWIVIAVLIFLYLLHGADFVYTFDDLMDFLHVDNEDRFRRYFTLGCVCVAVVAIVRILKRTHETH